MNTSESRHEYGLRDVVELTGMSKQLLHAWERRYQVVQPRRGDKTERLYSDLDVHRLQLLKKCVECGHRIGRLSTLDLESLKDISRSCDAVPDIPLGPVFSAIRSDDITALEQQLSVHFAALGPARFAELVVVPLMAEVGALWDGGQISIAGEHFVTAIVRTLLGQGLRLSEWSTDRHVGIFATPIGELHELGALTSAILAQSAGIRALYMGAQLPGEAIARSCNSLGAGLVCLSSIAMDAADLEHQVADVIAHLPEGVELWLGGSAFSGFDGKTVDGSFIFDDIPDFLHAMQRYRVRANRR